MAFPINRPRRLRRTDTLRRMIRETRLSPDDLIQPMFVCPGRDVKKAVASMPGVAQMSVDNVVREARETWAAGVPAVILFGIPERKDAHGSEAWNDEGEVQRAIREIKEHVPGLAVITDVCMCEYTDHGHCGVVTGNDVDNDATLELLAREALSHARAGADIVAPSDMMDGRVGAIRTALDEQRLQRTSRSWPTRRSSPRPFTDRFARPPSRRRSSATAAHTRWIRPTATRRCARSRSISRKARTS